MTVSVRFPIIFKAKVRNIYSTCALKVRRIDNTVLNALCAIFTIWKNICREKWEINWYPSDILECDSHQSKRAGPINKICDISHPKLLMALCLQNKKTDNHFVCNIFLCRSNTVISSFMNHKIRWKGTQKFPSCSRYWEYPIDTFKSWKECYERCCISSIYLHIYI